MNVYTAWPGLYSNVAALFGGGEGDGIGARTESNGSFSIYLFPLHRLNPNDCFFPNAEMSTGFFISLVVVCFQIDWLQIFHERIE